MLSVCTVSVCLKGHGNEPDFLRFLHKSVRHRSLELHFEPFRFWLRILGDIHTRKTTPRLSDSMIRGVGDSPHHWYAESTTPRISDGESGIEFFKRKLAVSMIRRVVDSAYRWVGESSTPRIVESESRRLRVSLIRRVANSPYRWVGESTTPRIGDTGSL